MCPDYFDEGFFVRAPAWHEMGTVLDDYPGREKAMELAGHNFEVKERSVWDAVDERPIAASLDDPKFKAYQAKQPEGVPVDYLVTADGVFRAAPEAGYKKLMKFMPGDTSNRTTLHIANESYGTVQNSTGWDIIDRLVGEGIKYETGITLKGGAVCSILAYLDEPIQIPGDNSPIMPYVNVSWSHDGTGAIKARPTSIRVVCWNTQQAAEAQGKRTGTEFTFRHTKDVNKHIEAAKITMKGLREANAAFLELALDMGSKKVTKAQRELFVTQFIKNPQEINPALKVTDRVARNIEEARTTVRSLFEGESISDDHRYTCWGLWCAGTEYLDHYRGYRDRGTLYGRQLMKNEPLKADLKNLVYEVAKA